MALNLSFTVPTIDKKTVENAKANRGTRYSGPTPPPGTYTAVVKKAWINPAEPKFRVLFELTDEDYKGCGIFNIFNLPVDPNHQYFDVQVGVLDDFVLAVTNGKHDVIGFMDSIANGKIGTDGDAHAKMGQPIKNVGPVKFTGKTVVEVEVTHSDNPNDANKPYLNVRNISAVGGAQAKAETPVVEEDLDLGDDVVEETPAEESGSISLDDFLNMEVED